MQNPLGNELSPAVAPGRTWSKTEAESNSTIPRLLFWQIKKDTKYNVLYPKYQMTNAWIVINKIIQVKLK